MGLFGFVSAQKLEKRPSFSKPVKKCHQPEVQICEETIQLQSRSDGDSSPWLSPKVTPRHTPNLEPRRLKDHARQVYDVLESSSPRGSNRCVVVGEADGTMDQLAKLISPSLKETSRVTSCLREVEKCLLDADELLEEVLDIRIFKATALDTLEIAYGKAGQPLLNGKKKKSRRHKKGKGPIYDHLKTLFRESEKQEIELAKSIPASAYLTIAMSALCEHGPVHITECLEGAVKILTLPTGTSKERYVQALHHIINTAFKLTTIPDPRTLPVKCLDYDNIEIAHATFVNYMHIYITDYIETAFEMSFMEPARLYLHLCGHDTTSDEYKMVNFRSRDFFAALVHSTLDIQLDSLRDYYTPAELGRKGVVDFWAGLGNDAWDMFSDHRNFGKRFDDMIGFGENITVYQKVPLGEFPVNRVVSPVPLEFGLSAKALGTFKSPSQTRQRAQLLTYLERFVHFLSPEVFAQHAMQDMLPQHGGFLSGCWGAAKILYLEFQKTNSVDGSSLSPDNVSPSLEELCFDQDSSVNIDNVLAFFRLCNVIGEAGCSVGSESARENAA